MKKTYIIIITILTIIATSRYLYISVYKHDYYYKKYLEISNKIVYGLNAPRGRILDRNGNILVDNIGINTIVFHQLDNTNIKEVSNILNNIIEVPTSSIEQQKKYYLKFEDTTNLLTKEEQLEYENMKLRIENERLKKGYIVEGDGQIVVFSGSKNKNLK